MRKMFANAMLCILLLLSVGSARCEAQCAVVIMPAAMQAAPASDSAIAMDSSMEHCGGMQGAHSDTPVLDAACGTSICRHQVLPATADSRIDFDGTQVLQPIVVPVTAVAVVLQTRYRTGDFKRPPLLQRSPLDQSSSLRV